MTPDADTHDSQRFDEVDWDALGEGGWRPSARTLSFLVLFGVLVAFYLYDVYLVAPGEPTIVILAESWQNDTVWDVSRVDWLSLFLGVVVVAYAVVPAVTDPGKLRAFWRDYPKDLLSLAALAYVLALGAVGLVGPVFLDQPGLALDRISQPPAFTSVPAHYAPSCLGAVEGGHCHGTMATPLGTASGGESVLAWLVYGARTTLQFALVSAVLMVPAATLVGTSAAYLGGRYDAVLMRYVEVQKAVPTVIVYVILVVFVGPTLFVLIVAYALFDWGDLAQLVRTEALSLSEEQYVTAARSAGAGPVTVVGRHLVPNLSGVVLASLGTTVPKLVLVEALFSFLKLSGDRSYSWGQLIQRGIFSGDLSGSILNIKGTFEGTWWVAVLPTIAVAVTVVAFFLFGDALQSVVEPNRE